ncbi:MAG TPA: lipoyl(octanoyl) transferase LipB [Bryobacteraceae bacterium]|nr:lipoyl(octanoyl) transferase LipB [Bryobacteraceae bacterium]
MHSVVVESGLPAEAGNSTLKRAPRCEWRDLGRADYVEAFEMQRGLVERRKRGEIADQFLVVEHPHTITLGRNGHLENLLAHEDVLARAGVAFHHTDRGGDITYHGPGQIVGYPIVDLREWKRDVGAYVRAIEQVIIDALADFGIAGERVPTMTGVWVAGAKIAAIGVHISRWVTSHGFALNVTTDLSYFQYIVPCGLVKPVTSMAALGVRARREDVIARLVHHFGRVFNVDMSGETDL